MTTTSRSPSVAQGQFEVRMVNRNQGYELSAFVYVSFPTCTFQATSLRNKPRKAYPVDDIDSEVNPGFLFEICLKTHLLVSPLMN